MSSNIQILNYIQKDLLQDHRVEQQLDKCDLNLGKYEK